MSLVALSRVPEEIRLRGYAVVDWRQFIDPAAVNTAFNCFEKLTAEDPAYLDGWRFDLSGKVKGAFPDDHGFRLVRNQGGQDTRDDKALFHYRQGVYGFRSLVAEKQVDVSKYHMFLAACEEIFTGSHALTQIILLDLIEKYQTKGNRLFVGDISRESFSENVLRLLQYQPQQILAKELATPHYDHSVITIALKATHPGLRLFPPGGPKEGISLELKDTEAVVFMGRKGGTLTDGDCVPLLHSVVNETSGGRLRYSAVYFRHLPVFPADDHTIVEWSLSKEMGS